jgi:hypothetical protein
MRQRDKARCPWAKTDLRADAGIVRNQLKIEAAVQNAKAFLAVQEDLRPAVVGQGVERRAPTR